MPSTKTPAEEMADRKFRRTTIRSPRARSILTVLLMKAVRAIAR